MIEVFIEELEFYAFHGVSEEERQIGHRYVASIELSVGDGALTSDDVKDTADYGEAAQLVLEVAGRKQYKTLEGLGKAICEAIFERFSGVKGVRLEIAKRLPPMNAIAERAGVRIERVKVSG